MFLLRMFRVIPYRSSRCCGRNASSSVPPCPCRLSRINKSEGSRTFLTDRMPLLQNPAKKQTAKIQNGSDGKIMAERNTAKTWVSVITGISQFGAAAELKIFRFYFHSFIVFFKKAFNECVGIFEGSVKFCDNSDHRRSQLQQQKDVGLLGFHLSCCYFCVLMEEF